MGKALFDRQLVAGHMAQYLYKHILGWPVTFEDLKEVDMECYNSLKQLVNLVKSDDDVSKLGLTFATTKDVSGQMEVVELVEGGSDLKVNNENFPEYVGACMKYQMIDRAKPQLTELLLGFFDVIPEPLLVVFHFEELEMVSEFAYGCCSHHFVLTTGYSFLAANVWTKLTAL